ncbi:MAG TPA: hypothetical protein EYM54_10045 [Dehalococcoidia bacterium]|jgi:hypothetical protein|nr:hypothetical protein [Dehalococcoidia bacterium]
MYCSSNMASERIQRHIDSSLDEADQAVANEDLPTVASRARAVLRMDHENSDGLSYLLCPWSWAQEPAFRLKEI